MVYFQGYPLSYDLFLILDYPLSYSLSYLDRPPKCLESFLDYPLK
jgi:hypothetical protein